MTTKQNHGYLTEPRWYATRNVIRELVCVKTWAEIGSLAAIGFVLWAVVS